MAQRRQLHDEFFRKAKAEGYLARSAYKLLEIQERFGLIRRGDRVLDLGCAPGSWIQVAEELVGPGGVVVGIDLQDVRHPFPPHVRVLKGDIYATQPATFLEAANGESPAGGGKLFDVVISDMAPNTTGAGDDHLSARLCRRVLEVLPPLLRSGGHVVMKVLEGSDFPELLRECREAFGDVRGFKPKSSRDVSREMFIVNRRYRGGAAQAGRGR